MIQRTTKGSGSDHRHPPRALPKLPAEAQLRDAAGMFSALGDPSRLRLLVRLAYGEICVTELAEMEDEQMTTISARLRALYTARLVKRRREAKHVFYALSDEHVLQMINGAIEHASEQRSQG